jgi:hypothetical protein
LHSVDGPIPFVSDEMQLLRFGESLVQKRSQRWPLKFPESLSAGITGGRRRCIWPFCSSVRRIREKKEKEIGINGRSVDMVFWLKRILGRHCAQRTGGSCRPLADDTPVAVGAPVATSPSHTSLNEFSPGQQSERRRTMETFDAVESECGQRAKMSRTFTQGHGPPLSSANGRAAGVAG